MAEKKDKKIKYYIVLCASVGAFFGASLAMLIIPGVPYNKIIGGAIGALVNSTLIWYLLCGKK